VFLHERMSALASAVLHVLPTYEPLPSHAGLVASELNAFRSPGIAAKGPFLTSFNSRATR